MTLGGFRPGSAYHVLPAKAQLWWKPCVTRSYDGLDTHAWYLSPTSDGSLRCHVCRFGAPRVLVGPKDWIADVRDALELGDMVRVRELLASGPTPAIAEPPRFKPRDAVDWKEFYSERAAVFEFLGGHDRAAAELLARELAGDPPKYAAAGPLFAGAR
jgi:hypothetical protein